MDITATLKINKNQLTYKYAYTYSKVLITVCSNSVATISIILYFQEEYDWNPANYLKVLHQNRTQSSCSTNIFYYMCKTLFFLLISFMANFFEAL